MNFIYAFIDSTDLWKTEYICFNCGCSFKMYKSNEYDNINFTPACSNSCSFSLFSDKKMYEINKYQGKYGQNWKKHYLEKIKRNEKKIIEKLQ